MTTVEELLDLCRQHLDPHAQPVTQHTGHDRTSVLRAATGDDDVMVNPIAELDLPPEIERDVYGRAGALLATWHSAAAPCDTPDMTAWLAARGEQWLHLAESILPAQKRAGIRAHLRDLAGLGSLPTVPCHLDFTPRNLLYDAQGIVYVIDFEHARYDLAARDLVRLSDRVWRDRPDLEDAFLASYGRVSDLDRQIIEHCIHLDTLTAAVRPPAVPSRSVQRPIFPASPAEAS